MHESIVQDLNEIDSICLNLINNDDFFDIELSNILNSILNEENK